MKVYDEIENGIKYVVIHHDTIPTQDELAQALGIIHSSKFCKVWWYWDVTSSMKSFIYYKDGKVHNEDGVAMKIDPLSQWYGINGDVFPRNMRDNEKRDEKEDIEEIKKVVRKVKLNKIENSGKD